MSDWRAYQEDAAAYFRSLGLSAATNVTIQGVRTSHDIDVLVKSHYAGFEVTWIVECKQWQSRVSKLHVLALREIVSDVGADRGILLSEAGFQSGAIEAANLTNVQVTSIAAMQVAASDTVYAMRLRDLLDRTDKCKIRYWDISKEDRIRYGIRTWDATYSGARVTDLCFELLTRALRESYPFTIDTMTAWNILKEDKNFSSPKEVVDLVEHELTKLEGKLDAYDQWITDNHK